MPTLAILYCAMTLVYCAFQMRNESLRHDVKTQGDPLGVIVLLGSFFWPIFIVVDILSL